MDLQAKLELCSSRSHYFRRLIRRGKAERLKAEKQHSEWSSVWGHKWCPWMRVQKEAFTTYAAWPRTSSRRPTSRDTHKTLTKSRWSDSFSISSLVHHSNRYRTSTLLNQMMIGWYDSWRRIPLNAIQIIDPIKILLRGPMKNIPLSNVEWEMLQAIAKKQRKKSNQVISDFLKKTYMALWRQQMEGRDFRKIEIIVEALRRHKEFQQLWREPVLDLKGGHKCCAC